MTQALILGLISALLYGTTDFVAGYASRAAGVLRTMFYGQVLIGAAIGIYLAIEGRWPAADAGAYLVLLVSDTALLVATGCLYRALATGRLAVVAPVTACYGAVGAVFAIGAGEQVTPLAAAGLVLAVFGGIVAAVPAPAAVPAVAAVPAPAAVPARAADTPSVASGSGAALAGTAALLYGAGLWLQGRYSVPAFGVLVSVWSYYVVGIAWLIVFGLAFRQDLSLPPMSQIPMVFGTALLAGSAGVALAAGQATGAVAVATALSSAASAVTVILARIFIKEAVAPRGWLGVGAVVGGSVLLHAS